MVGEAEFGCGDGRWGCWVVLVKYGQGRALSLFFLRMLDFKVVFPIWPIHVLQNLSCCQNFQKLSCSFPRLCREITLPLLCWKTGSAWDYLKTIMVFNVHRWWFICPFLASLRLSWTLKHEKEVIRRETAKDLSVFLPLQRQQSANPICQACGVILKPVKCADWESCHFSYGHMVTIAARVIYRSHTSHIHYYKHPDIMRHLNTLRESYVSQFI